MAFHTAFRAASILLVTLLLSLPAHATSLMRDADMEYALREVATPVLKAAGLSPARVKILVIDNGSPNAFVVSNDAIFIHSGLLSRMDNAAMLQGVIAHEAAHIANGHITRRLTNLGNARTAAGLGLALAVAAATAGAGEAAAGIAIGTQSSAQRSFLAHTRAEESSADQSALRYLRSAGISPTGLLQVMELFRGQEHLSGARQDPYVRSHPLSRDRVRVVEGFVAAYGDTRAEDPTTAYWFARAKGKLTAYQRSARWTLTRAGESGYKDVRLMREAIAHHKQSRTRKALQAVDQAIALRPTDPFFHDLKGEILMETRNFAAAANVYGRAVRLAPRDGLVLAGYGRALLASGNVSAALPALEKSRSIDFRDGSMLRDLSVAYAKSGQTGMAALVTAERYALVGRLDDAGIHAKRATDLLPTGSGSWQRAQDVLIAFERAEKQKKRR